MRFSHSMQCLFFNQLYRIYLGEFVDRTGEYLSAPIYCDLLIFYLNWLFHSRYSNQLLFGTK